MKKGISLIILLIIIILLLIIVGIIFLSFFNSDVIEKAKEAKLDNDISKFKDELTINIINENLESKSSNILSANEDKLIINGEEQEGKNIYDVLPSIQENYKGDFIVQDNKLIYIKEELEEQQIDLEEQEKLHTNLVINGSGIYENNTNFANTTYNPNISFNGSDGSFEIDGKNIIMTDNYIHIDSSKKYRISMDVKGKLEDQLTYITIFSYNIDDRNIDQFDVGHIKGTLTSLKEDINDGDTVIKLEDATNWYDGNIIYERGIIFWNYQDSRGFVWPEETYSRNKVIPIWNENNINHETNEINLSSAWRWGKYSAGTKVSNTTGTGGSYIFTWKGRITTGFETYSSTIQGLGDGNSILPGIDNSFRYGTVKIKLGILTSYNNVDGKTWITNVRFEEIEE